MLSKNLLKPSLHWLLLFIPLVLAMERILPDKPVLIFLSAAIAIIPVANLIVRAAEPSASSSRFCFTFFPEIKV